MDYEYVRDEYDQYYLLIHSDFLFPEHDFALVAPDGFVHEGGTGVSNWTTFSKLGIPYGVWRRFEHRIEILEKLEAKREAEIE